MFSTHLKSLLPFSSNLKLSSANSFSLEESKILSFGKELKVAVQIVVRKFYKNAKISSLYSQSLLIFIDRTPVFERHPITREIKRFTMAQVDINGKHGLFLH